MKYKVSKRSILEKCKELTEDLDLIRLAEDK